MFLRLIFIGVQLLSLPSGSDGKESACNAGDLGCAPGLGRSPGEGNGHPVQRSCLGKSLLGCKKLGVVALQVHVSFDSMAVNQSQVHTCPLPSGLASNLGDYSAWLLMVQLCSLGQFSPVQLLSRVRLFATPWTAACQVSLSITNSQSLLKLMSLELVLPSSHVILCHPLLLPSIFPSISLF